MRNYAIKELTNKRTKQLSEETNKELNGITAALRN
jgi:hypothetical protein